MFDQNFSSLEQIKHETTHEERKKDCSKQVQYGLKVDRNNDGWLNLSKIENSWLQQIDQQQENQTIHQHKRDGY